MCRYRYFHTSVHFIACSTAAKSASDSSLKIDTYGFRPDRTNCSTNIPSGAVVICGNKAIWRANSFVFHECKDFSSSDMVPCFSLISRAKAFKNVDFPEPFGPIIDIISGLSKTMD